ncbi:hypothetical protein EV702DRAFT_1237402 [Suillus placidus]|uniref:Uncharacterized protein n=1 Tax=Suillus placidus TaxID=48579 RepID=A0A9P7D1B4_9AGAM|nr:hypothetical protein EV702DRAFT_1237402 [Suillus placidus]
MLSHNPTLNDAYRRCIDLHSRAYLLESTPPRLMSTGFLGHMIIPASSAIGRLSIPNDIKSSDAVTVGWSISSFLSQNPSPSVHPFRLLFDEALIGSVISSICESPDDQRTTQTNVDVPYVVIGSEFQSGPHDGHRYLLTNHYDADYFAKNLTKDLDTLLRETVYASSAWAVVNHFAGYDVHYAAISSRSNVSKLVDSPNLVFDITSFRYAIGVTLILRRSRFDTFLHFPPGFPSSARSRSFFFQPFVVTVTLSTVPFCIWPAQSVRITSIIPAVTLLSLVRSQL